MTGEGGEVTIRRIITAITHGSAAVYHYHLYGIKDHERQLCIAEAKDLVSETAPSTVHEDIAGVERLFSQAPDLLNSWS